MNIILITKKGRSRHHLHLSTMMHYMAVAATFLLMAFSFTGLGYWLGAKYQSDGYIRAWQSELDEQRLAVANLRDMTEAKVGALTTRIGQMHGHITRLNALGDKLVKMANLDESEFEFDSPPAVGGPGEAAVVENTDQGALENAITKLGLELGYREYQLFVLEEILRSRNLHEEVHPAGLPVIKGWVSSYFGYRNNPFEGGVGRELHKGLDIAAKEGTEIVAVAGGVVTWSDKRLGYGNMVEIDHGNGYSTRYGHCSSLLVKEGEAVKKGQIVALMGSTGRSTGPHVHFEVLKEGTQVNPLDFIYASH